MWYSVGRFFIEYLRTDSLMIGKMKVSMLVSALLFIVCLALLLYMFKKSENKSEQKEYVSLFKEQFEDDETETLKENEETAETADGENNDIKEEENV